MPMSGAWDDPRVHDKVQEALKEHEQMARSVWTDPAVLAAALTVVRGIGDTTPDSQPCDTCDAWSPGDPTRCIDGFIHGPCTNDTCTEPCEIDALCTCRCHSPTHPAPEEGHN